MHIVRTHRHTHTLSQLLACCQNSVVGPIYTVPARFITKLQSTRIRGITLEVLHIMHYTNLLSYLLKVVSRGQRICPVVSLSASLLHPLLPLGEGHNSSPHLFTRVAKNKFTNRRTGRGQVLGQCSRPRLRPRLRPRTNIRG